jgi:hypothetical protein
LNLSKEDEGQGLVHLASCAAASRFQFIQRLLYGRENVFCQGVVGLVLHQVGGLGFKEGFIFGL